MYSIENSMASLLQYKQHTRLPQGYFPPSNFIQMRFYERKPLCALYYIDYFSPSLKKISVFFKKL